MKKVMLLLSCLAAVFSGCGGNGAVYVDEWPDIFPDYVGVTVPETMAQQMKCVTLSDGTRVRTSEKRCGDTLFISVEAKGLIYKPFPVYVSKDSIDPYIAYRLIEPGYESWNSISICGRELASFKEEEIVTNKVNDKGCVNCHTFQGGNPGNYMFHARGRKGGTVFVDGEGVHKVNLAEVGPGMQGTYPAWNPDGQTIAFSSNVTRQNFSVAGSQPVEVFDTSSDLILYDVAGGEVRAVERTVGNGKLETFPAWSSSGDRLYWCSADSVENIGLNRGKVHYNIRCAEWRDGELSERDSVVWQCDSASASFPRINGKWLLFTRSACGTFPIWHTEADLVLMNLETGEFRAVEELNSPETESYHSWSRNGRWIVFSSRRLDGRYTRLYISHFDGEGHFGKPFLLPQKNPDHNVLRMKSYNIPEFVCGKPVQRQSEIKKLFR